MYTPDALEDINIDQLVTATDRLLLRGSPSHSGRNMTDVVREAKESRAAAHARRGRVDVRPGLRRRQLLTGFAVILGAWLGVVTACLLT